MKKCTKCGIDKDENEFYKVSRRKKNGEQSLRSICKDCTNLVSSEWQKQNIDKARKASRAFYSRNSEKVRQIQRDRRSNWSDEQREKVRKQQAKYREENKEPLKKKRKESYDPQKNSVYCKEYYAKNHARELERKRKYYYSLDESGKKRLCQHSKTWRNKNPEKVAAHKILEAAINKGEISKKTHCECCLRTRVLDGHHEDYSNPLEVVWLCRQCHAERHKD